MLKMPKYKPEKRTSSAEGELQRLLESAKGDVAAALARGKEERTALMRTLKNPRHSKPAERLREATDHLEREIRARKDRRYEEGQEAAARCEMRVAMTLASLANLIEDDDTKADDYRLAVRAIENSIDSDDLLEIAEQQLDAEGTQLFYANDISRAYRWLNHAEQVKQLRNQFAADRVY